MTGPYKKAAAILMMTAAAVSVAQSDGIIRLTASGLEIPAVKLTSSPDGVLEYEGTGKVRVQVKPGSYLYAWIPKPAAVEKADALLQKDPGAALKLFSSSAEKYKYLGWDIYCMIGMARALRKQGMLKEAIAVLDRAGAYKLQDPRQMAHASAIHRLSLDCRIESGDTASAEKIMNLQSPEDPSMAAFFCLKRAQIAEKKGNRSVQARYLVQAAFLFPDTEEAPLALYQLWSLLSSQKDPKAEIFRLILKTEYPKSEYSVKLK